MTNIQFYIYFYCFLFIYLGNTEPSSTKRQNIAVCLLKVNIVTIEKSKLFCTDGSSEFDLTTQTKIKQKYFLNGALGFVK